MPKPGVDDTVWSSDQSRLPGPLPTHESVWPHHPATRGLQNYPGLCGTIWHRGTPRSPLSIRFSEGQSCEPLEYKSHQVVNKKYIPPHALGANLSLPCPIRVIYYMVMWFLAYLRLPRHQRVRQEINQHPFFSCLMSPSGRFQQLDKSMDPFVARRCQAALTQEVIKCMSCSDPTLVGKIKGGRSSTPAPRLNPSLWLKTDGFICPDFSLWVVGRISQHSCCSITFVMCFIIYPLWKYCKI